MNRIMAPERKFPWKRFWCPPDALLHLESDGFLTDCENTYGKMFAPETKGFQEIEKTHCLILLGEPGIGKSTAMYDEISRIPRIEGSGQSVTVINLKEYGSEDCLWKDLFENAMWQDYIEGRCALQLFLDGLDEVRIRINNVQNLLVRGFRNGPRDSLFLRIACRTAEWPSSFYDQLCNLWSREEVQVFELAPLSRKNAIQAAELVGINADSFIKTIQEKGIGALASKPITLNFLLDLYLAEGDLPPGQIELYRKGCLYLCEEPDKERREKRDINRLYTGLLGPAERLAIASRIAAALTFSNSYAVHRDGFSGTPEGCVSVMYLTGGTENIGSRVLEVSEDAVRDTLKTGLFSSRGADLFGFAHQTYQEHLAAYYLARADIKQIKELLVHPHDVSAIVPQLKETAAWVAGERFDVMRWIMSIAPENLMRSDLSTLDTAAKKDLTRELLEGFVHEDLFDELSLRENYHKLAHPELAQQLKAVIEDEAASFIARRAAIDIAEACEEISLQELLADIALDTSETVGLRAQAAHAVSEIADEDTRQRLQPLAEGKQGADPDDELRAAGLKCMWPSHWGVPKLFENLIPVKNKNLVGAYSYFLRYEGPEQLKKSQIPSDQIVKALAIVKEWIGKGTDYDSHHFGPIYNELVRVSLRQTLNTKIMAELSDIIFRTIMHGPFYDDHDEDLNPWKEVSSEAEKRRQMVKSMVTNGMLSERDAPLLLVGEISLLADSDFPWMLDEIEGAVGSAELILWAKLIVGILNPNMPVEWIDDFLAVRLRVPALQNEYLVYWELDSDLSKRFKKGYEDRLRWEQKAKHKPRVPSIFIRIAPLLRNIETGRIEQWLALTHNLWISEDTGRLRHEGQIDLTGSPGWQILDDTLRARIEEAATRFIMNYSPPSDEWFGKHFWGPDVLSICMALSILSKRTDLADQIKEGEWKKWIPYMVDNPVSFGDATSHCQLFSLAYKNAPETTKEYLVQLMKNENRLDQGIYCLEHLKTCWHPDLTELMLKVLTECELKAKSFCDVASHLVEMGTEKIETIVIDKLRAQIHQGGPPSDLLVELVLIVLNHWPEKYWPDVWKFLKEDKGLSLRVLGHIGPGYRRAGFVEQLSESHLGDLYSYMCELWPLEDDPQWTSGVFTERHRLAEVRNSVFMILVNKGTKEACLTIESLIDRFKDDKSWMAWRLREAKANYLKKTWNSPSAAQIIELLSDSSKRYVENEEELLKVVLESLSRFQARCKSSPLPTAGNFWNYQGSANNRTNFRPKDEEDLSDGIAAWLKDDLGPSRGIIINREVQPRRGQKTDIYVNAVGPSANVGSSNILTIVAEVVV